MFLSGTKKFCLCFFCTFIEVFSFQSKLDYILGGKCHVCQTDSHFNFDSTEKITSILTKEKMKLYTDLTIFEVFPILQ